MEKAVRFIIDHNESIIEWSIVAILVLCLTWIILHYFFGAGESAEGGISHNQLDQLEKTLQSVLERSASGGVVVAARSASSSASSGGGDAGEASSGGEAGEGAASLDGASSEELEKLKLVLEDREVTIDELKVELEKAREASNDQELIDKIKVLEERLAEYEIIEDDIADLSAYKEENARLKEELDKLKAGGAVASDEAETASAEAPAEDITEGVVEGEDATPEEEPASVEEENLVDNFEAAAATEEENAEPAPAEEPAPEAAQDAVDALLSEAAAETDEQETPAEEPAPEAAQDAVDALLAESSAEPEPAPEVQAAIEPEPVSIPEEEPPVEESLTADQMAEAVAALANEGNDENQGDMQEPPPEEVDVPEPAPAASASDDILGEFTPDEGGSSEAITQDVVDEIAGSVVDQMAADASDTAANEEETLAENIDTDKMLNEISEMGDVEADSSALEDEMDVDKMAAEATKLASDN